MQSFTHSLKDSNDMMSFSINKELMSFINMTLFCSQFNILSVSICLSSILFWDVTKRYLVSKIKNYKFTNIPIIHLFYFQNYF